MRYAIISDIHGNLEALEAVLADIEAAGADRRLCLGDIVGYGARPVECAARIKAEGIEAVVGNHDSAALGDTPLDYFNPYAKEAVLWTARRIDEETRSFLGALPLTRVIGDFTLVHASLDRPADWGYIMDGESARRCFERMNTDICFIGHSHAPLVFAERETVEWREAVDTPIEEGVRYIVNAGSVGQPRDGDPRACYVIYDSAARTVFFRRVRYDVTAAQKKIIAAGLPAFLALRLGMGR